MRRARDDRAHQRHVAAGVVEPRARRLVDRLGQDMGVQIRRNFHRDLGIAGIRIGIGALVPVQTG